LNQHNRTYIIPKFENKTLILL